MMKNLKILNLHGNQLTSIKSGAFQELRNLTHLTIFDNKLTSIEPDAFQGLENLKSLHFDNNQFDQIITRAPLNATLKIWRGVESVKQ